MDSTSAVDGYCWGAVFLYVVEVVKIKKKRASFSSRETLLSHIKFLKNNQEKNIILQIIANNIHCRHNLTNFAYEE